MATNPADAFAQYTQTRRAFWDGVAQRGTPGASASYHRRIERVYRYLVPAGSSVIDLGCGEGDLLASLRPSRGVGVDFSSAMIKSAATRHAAIPNLRFVNGDAHDPPVSETFDVVLLSDLVNDLWDVQRVLERVRPLCTPHTRVIINFYSRLWHLPLSAARLLGMARPELPQNWLTPHDVSHLLFLSGFEPIRRWQEVLCPIGVPLLTPLCNRWLAKLPGLRHLALTNFVIARPAPARTEAASKPPRVSVIVPARNEAGNIANIIERTPQMLGGTELIFVEGHSKDDTYATLQREIAKRPDAGIKLFQQTGKGKGDAVRLGFAKATGDILMILDADLTVPPEDLPRFANALASGQGEFINGVRLVYPMEERAMRFINLLGNKFFSLAFTWVLGQPIKDTLCGTKVLHREAYERIARNRTYFGDFDPFGDFDLIFGAAKLNLKIIDLPIRYRERTYGETNIDRWRHGALLLRMLAFAARRIKFF